MPLIVDKEKIKIEILDAYNRLSDDRPVTDISLREISREAGMSHSKVLRYFGNKNSLNIAAVHRAGQMLCEQIAGWFGKREKEEFPDDKAYLNAFFHSIAESRNMLITPKKIILTTALASYSEELQVAVREEMEHIFSVMKEQLESKYERTLSIEEIYTVFFMYFGIYYVGFIDPELTEVDVVKGMAELFSYEKYWKM